MLTYREQLENAVKQAHFKLEEAAQKGSVKAIADGQMQLEKVEAALSKADA